MTALVIGALLMPAMLLPREPPPERVRVFVDCYDHGCDSQEFRTEITFVDWVRDPAAADVHVIITAEDTGAGTKYTFDFVGRGGFDGADATLTHTVPDTDSRDEVVRGLTSVLAAGLVPYVARRGYADRLRIGAAPRPHAAPRATAVADAWDLWIFSVGGDLSADGEAHQMSHSFGVHLGANRTTPFWKLDFSVDGEVDRDEFELNEGERFVSASDDWDADALVVRSITPHWSLGTAFGASRSTQFNRRYGARTALAVEWSLFPYALANRKQLVVHYELGISQVAYRDTTIFGKLDERLGQQGLAVVYDTRQPWGDASAAILYSNLLADWSKYHLSLGGELSFRIFRGLSLDLDGSYEIVRDQLYLPAGELSDKEIIAQQRQLATDFEYELDVGFSYSFGSIFNNVVNNRFPWEARDF